MCLIVFNKDKEFPYKLFYEARDRNRHGLGVVYEENGELVIEKALGMTAQRKLFVKHRTKQNAMWHLRYATAGSVSKENIHPFEVTNVRDHGLGIVIAHNGTMPNEIVDNKKENDSKFFINNYLKPILIGQPSLIHNAEFRKMVKMTIGWNNRLGVITSDGYQYTIGSFYSIEGMKLSNRYSCPVFFRKAEKKEKAIRDIINSQLNICQVDNSTKEVA